MNLVDRAFDATLIGYTSVGFALRGLDVDDPFLDLDGKVVVVSGATGGIGKATVQRLARNGATVHAIGRSPEKLDALVSTTDGKVVAHCADLSIMEETARVGREIVEQVTQIDGLANNVGVMAKDRTETAEEFELSYATNLLGQYVLTETLKPKFAAGSRIVFVSSGGMYSQALTAANIESSDGEFNGTNAYARTKRGQVVLAEDLNTGPDYELASVFSMHPGWVDTDGVKGSLPTFRKLTKWVLRDASQGADTIVWLLGAPNAEGLAGEFVHDRKPRPKHRLKSTRTPPEVRNAFFHKIHSDAEQYLNREDS